MILKSLNIFIDIAKSKSKKTIAVAAAEDKPVLEAVANAYNQGICDAVLVGDETNIQKLSSEIGFDLSNIEIINEINPALASQKAVELVKTNKAQILMKGLVSTADFLRAVLNKEKGLRTGKLLSHISFFESPNYHKLIALTDVAQNIAPSLEEKVAILDNAIDMFHRLGIEKPKIALLAAVENVNPKMPATIDAAILTMMNKRNQIKECIIDGPLAFDNAVSKEATVHKGIVSDVAGDSDLLFVPNIEVGNVLYKSFTYFGNAIVSAIIIGAAAPIVLTSRADSDRSKLMSIALAATY